MMEHSQFYKGGMVEVSCDDAGLRGAWFIATVLRANSRRNKVFVEYQSLMADEKGSKPLREFVDAVNVRPLAPREANRSFRLSDEVDALHNDGWWEGVVTQVLQNSRYKLYFRASKEELEFSESELRIHREWVNGSWIPPIEELDQSTSSVLGTNQNEDSSDCLFKFREGTLVEVSSDEEGFVGAWFTAKVVKKIGEFKFLVEYQTLKTEDETELLKEEVYALHVRPSPPEIPQTDCFNRLEEVDALHNDGWWVGVISKVLTDRKYVVYFKDSEEELVLEHSVLRLHQDWINGKWFRPSQAL